MSSVMPRDFTVNGIERLGIAVVGQRGQLPKPLEENTMQFTTLAFAIHAGISILENPKGRDTLRQLGVAVVQGWTGGGDFDFDGDPARMHEYVDIFLASIRSDFPRVILDSLGGPDIIAEARRIPCKENTLTQYNPKRAGGIYYSQSQVGQMALAADEAHQNSRGTRTAVRYRTFLFKFAVATAHELAHLFVGYLAQGQDTMASYTPPTVSHLNYARQRGQPGVPHWGESGRWLENRLFGGSIEFYRDIRDDDGQVCDALKTTYEVLTAKAGIPYLLDENANARRIEPDCVTELVTRIDRFNTFPFTTQEALTLQQRIDKGLLSMGSTEVSGWHSSGTFMRSRPERSEPLYNISASELCLVPVEPFRRALKKIKVA